ncbi:hypothetical protein CKO51_02895 [Rhodopirellula sp. SM50]|nr:hypothetical protein [Rhodopirellula sp. SM50]PAY21011.1 hypothetical protein CKO51_02895 [Rhodopirellula sp. SM50]
MRQRSGQRSIIGKSWEVSLNDCNTAGLETFSVVRYRDDRLLAFTPSGVMQATEEPCRLFRLIRSFGIFLPGRPDKELQEAAAETGDENV